MLKINKLSKSYGENNVLKEISVNFIKGNIYGIIGHNGTGKSTFFRCICQLEKYKGGISFADCSHLRMEVNYLPTSPFFYPKITGKEYLTFFQKINTKSRDINISEWNKLFQLPLNKYVEEYSSGMKKKISFFGILLQEKPIYIFDEPFNGVDLDSVLIFKKVILQLKNKNSIILISSHIIDTLTDISDKIFFLNNGKFEKEYTAKTYKNIEKDISKNLIAEIEKLNI